MSVQCPVKVFRKTFDEALSNKLKKWVPYLKKTPQGIEVYTKSSWYAEAQGQLHITGRTEKTNYFWTEVYNLYYFTYFRTKICLSNRLAGDWIHNKESVSWPFFLEKFDGKQTSVFLWRSHDQGACWSKKSSKDGDEKLRSRNEHVYLILKSN